MNKIETFVKNNKIKITIYIIALFLFLIDIITKSLILRSGNLLYQKTIIPNFFYLTLAKNTGAAFSILQNATWIFVVIAICFIIYIDRTILKEKLNKLQIISFSLLIGGVLGNLFDRIFNGYVTDFLHFIIFGYDFPIFNFADIFIVVGAILLIIDVIFKGGKNENRSTRKNKW